MPRYSFARPGIRRLRPPLALLPAAFALGLAACEDDPPTTAKLRKVFVPETYATVAEALENAVPGDSIYVAAERIPFEILGATIQIRSEQTPFYITSSGKGLPQLIAPADGGPLLRVQNPRPGTVIEKLAFAGGNAAVELTGGGELVVRRCVFTGGVVQVRASGGGPRAIVEECLMLEATLFGVEGASRANVIARRNTIVDAGDCGILIGGDAAGVLNANLIVRPFNFGIACTQNGALRDSTGCNDIFDAGQDPYLNCEPPATDFSADPLFCNEAGGDYAVDARSPCAVSDSTACAPVGAFGVNCGTEPPPPFSPR